ncbi:MAG: phosphoserine phosphatase SerB [Deltaproteobacteria bacterium]|nr:phosphoserine phosphatase SerB [Deltaproteobacteria bacterium]
MKTTTEIPGQRRIATGESIVLQIAGPDRPGVTSMLTSIIAEERATLVSIGQSVLNGFLMLSAIVSIPPSSNALHRILLAVSEMGLRLDVRTYQQSVPVGADRACRLVLCVTMLGELQTGAALSHVTQFFAKREMNILDIRTISDDRLDGLELFVGLPGERRITDDELATLRGEILSVGRTHDIDVAVQKDDIYRRSKRLVCLDVDSTFVQGELIDELAELVGCKEQVAAITQRTMAGELDFSQALTERVALLEGLSLERAQKLAATIETTPGAELLAATLKSLGFKVGLVSGGFDFFVDTLKSRYELDFTFANELEVQDGRLTGRVRGTIVDPQRKAQLLRDMAKVYQLRLEQTVAVGDGANDMLMLQTAGLGIAYRAKPKLQQVADMSVNHHVGLDALLYLMGFTQRELRWLSDREL